jgi:type II secretory pathway component GspD/PulD (secretin)
MPSVLVAACLAAACATPSQESHTESHTTAFHLQHTKAQEMADTVGQFLAEARAMGAIYPTIRAHAATNTLLLEGTSNNMHKLIKLIQNLDVPRPK